jgi:hypothetical protein
MSERQLANGVSESILYMTGRIPRKTCAYCTTLAWLTVAASIAGTLWGIGRAMA